MILILLLGGVIGLQAVHERRGGVPAVDTPDMLYVRSPEAMKRLALSYQSLLADVYWIRAVQHYGGTRLTNDPNASYDLLYPLLDLTTSLDPRFNVAYLFGSLFLAGPPPGGPGRPDLAIALLEKGLRAQPDRMGVRPGDRIRPLLVAAGLSARRPRGSSAPPTCRADPSG